MIFLLLKFLKRHLVFLMDVSVLNETPALCIDSRGTSWMRLHCFALHCLFTLFHFFFFSQVMCILDGAGTTVAAESLADAAGLSGESATFHHLRLPWSSAEAPPHCLLPPTSVLSSPLGLDAPPSPAPSCVFLRPPPPSPPHTSHPSFFSHCHA